MNFRFKCAAAAVLAASLISSGAHATSDRDPNKPVKKAAKKAAEPSVEDQIEKLRQELQGQIDSLKQSLSDKDQQLQKAQQAAADAQAAAARAEAASAAQNQAVTENAAAVGALQGTVTDLKANQVSLATTVSDETASMKKAIESPNALHYKGINLTPGGYAAAESVFRTRATGGDIPTPFTGIPFAAADAGHITEFYADARQSRLSLMAEGKASNATLRGYWEGDWLGTGVTSNNNQSNSYVLRERVLWGQMALNNGLAFTGGQLWSLATEDKKAISNLSGDILTPHFMAVCPPSQHILFHSHHHDLFHHLFLI